MSEQKNLNVNVEAGSATEETAVIQKTVKRKWQSYVWDSFDKSPEERRFIFKLDSALLTICCLGYFIKTLDTSNLTNAFVSGMKEDLSLYKNQLNYMQTCWTVGYIIGEVPANMLLTRIRPSIFIPILEVIWSILTMCLARTNNATQIYALRFFIGLSESAFYPGMQYVIGSWYRKDELAKRSSIFHASGGVAGMVSGYLMTAVYHLNGKRGIAGWKWLFIMNGVISIPVGLSGFFLIPDLPETSRALYLSKTEIAYAKKRMEFEGREKKQPYTKAKFVKILTSWHIYLFSLLYVAFSGVNGSMGLAFPQWLKDSKHPKYSIAQINNYPTGSNAIFIVTELILSWWSDTFLNGRRYPPVVLVAALMLIFNASLSVPKINLTWRWICYYLTGVGGSISGLMFAWAHEVCSDDNEERAIVVATMNEMGYVLSAWLPLIVWQQVDAPQYTKGFITATAISVLLAATALLIKFLHKRETLRKQRDKKIADDLSESISQTGSEKNEKLGKGDGGEIGVVVRSLD